MDIRHNKKVSGRSDAELNFRQENKIRICRQHSEASSKWGTRKAGVGALNEFQSYCRHCSTHWSSAFELPYTKQGDSQTGSNANWNAPESSLSAPRTRQYFNSCRNTYGNEYPVKLETQADGPSEITAEVAQQQMKMSQLTLNACFQSNPSAPRPLRTNPINTFHSLHVTRILQPLDRYCPNSR